MNKKKYPAPDGDLIIIRLNGDETVASILDCDFGIGCTGQAIAKRNPKDEYDAYIGARVALDRLFDKDDMFADKMPEETKKAPEPVKTEAQEEETEFQVGDIVRVTNAGFTFGRYENGDIAVVTKVVSPLSVWRRTTYDVKVRSKKRKGSKGVAFAEELNLLHRPAKEGEKR